MREFVSRPTKLQFAHCRAKIRSIQTALDIEEFDQHAVASLLRSGTAICPETVIFGSHSLILPRKGYVELIRAIRTVIDRLNPVERKRCRRLRCSRGPEYL